MELDENTQGMRTEKEGKKNAWEPRFWGHHNLELFINIFSVYPSLIFIDFCVAFVFIPKYLMQLEHVPPASFFHVTSQ